MEPQAKAAQQLHDLGDFFRQEVAPTHRAVGALRVAEELTRRGMREAAVVAVQVAQGLMAGDPTEPQVIVQSADEPDPHGAVITIAELLDANRDDEAFCEVLRSLHVGGSMDWGGGASPEVHIRRVS